jgi:hypothetical protein
MKKTLTALAVAASLAGGAAFAQEAEMDQSLSMLEVAAQRELAKVGITDVDVMTLTLSQLAEIKAITGSTDSNGEDMARAVKQVIERN